MFVIETKVEMKSQPFEYVKLYFSRFENIRFSLHKHIQTYINLE